MSNIEKLVASLSADEWQMIEIMVAVKSHLLPKSRRRIKDVEAIDLNKLAAQRERRRKYMREYMRDFTKGVRRRK